MKERATKFFTPVGVFWTSDGGECLLRRMANGVHVIGPYTVDSMGYWPTVTEAAKHLEDRFGPGEWEYLENVGAKAAPPLRPREG